MGQTQTMIAEIEIQASPETVRSVFLDFSRYKEWNGWKVESSNTLKRPDELQPKEKLKVDLGTMKFSPALLQNSPDAFEWHGNLWPIFSGKHEFTWQPSSKTPGGTTFRQKEDFTGLLAFLMAPGRSFSKKSLDNWESFNADLKKEVEKRL
ncbi:hypothetical protein CDV36_010283 [Fusarium kuroshium]|uniref:SRPBCC domain-containing protein n=1 Tax=Fusarium kuroshium TaxID=2010991 RepID=A0A3M2RY67_9HYPO|nr:hypothetical protein CDV36_010283 [Fusarium kuroshium]